MPVPRCFLHCISVIELDVRDGDPSGSSCIVQDCFGYPGCFVFPYEVGYFSLKVCKELCWDFYVNCIDSLDFF